MGEDGARGKDWLWARGHHLCLTDTFFLVLDFIVSFFVVDNDENRKFLLF